MAFSLQIIRLLLSMTNPSQPRLTALDQDRRHTMGSYYFLDIYGLCLYELTTPYKTLQIILASGEQDKDAKYVRRQLRKSGQSDSRTNRFSCDDSHFSISIEIAHFAQTLVGRQQTQRERDSEHGGTQL